MRPRLEWLETFLAICESGSLTRAGERLARSQSAVSLQLRRLEETVGVRLFERDTRHVRLTAAGERLIPQARRALEAADAAVRIVGGGPRRTVRVGVPEEYAEVLIEAVLDGVARYDSALGVEVESAASQELEQRIGSRRLDLAFALAAEVVGPGVPVLADPVVWLQAAGSDLGTRRPLPVALFDQACSWRTRALEALAAASIEHRVVLTSTSVAGVRAGIRAGRAIGALALSTAGDDLVPVRGPDAPPSLPTAELVALHAGEDDEDLSAVVTRVRQHLTARLGASSRAGGAMPMTIE